MSFKVIKDITANIAKSLDQMSAKEVYVGVPQAESSRGESKTNAEIGYINEFGSPINNIPPRPHLVPGVASAKEQTVNILKKGASNALVDIARLDKALTAVGLLNASAVKLYIKAGTNLLPLAEKTLEERRAKGAFGEKPLIRTAQYLKSITYVVRNK
jgi:hypothetical protein